jgi:hypothetical protein
MQVPQHSNARCCLGRLPQAGIIDAVRGSGNHCRAVRVEVGCYWAAIPDPIRESSQAMSRRTTQRLVAVVALTAILLFAYGAVNHWHSTPTAQDHCQVCHVAHSLSVGISCAAILLAPAMVVRRIVLARIDPALDLESRHVSSRAPPFAFQLS